MKGGPMRRRHLVIGATVAAAAAWVGRAAAQGGPRVVEITARRFRYEPAEVPLKAGERVVIAVRSLDFVHGLNIPDLGMRFDLPPGRVTRFEIQPMQAGVIDFLCDNFCGDHHEEMSGRFVVT